MFSIVKNKIYFFVEYTINYNLNYLCSKITAVEKGAFSALPVLSANFNHEKYP
jgi:hypothetical protein